MAEEIKTTDPTESGVVYMEKHTEAEIKPLFRGWHHKAFVCTLPFWLIWLLHRTSSQPLAQTGVSLCVGSMTFCFGVSAMYHRGSWSKEREEAMAKMDMFGILILMAYNSSPVFLLFDPSTGISHLLFLAFETSILGLCLLYPNVSVPRPLYRTLFFLIQASLIGLFIGPTFYTHSTMGEKYCWLLGLVSYLVGSIVYACQRPILYPRIFGYHELFHVLTIVSAVCTLVTNKSIVARYTNV